MRFDSRRGSPWAVLVLLGVPDLLLGQAKDEALARRLRELNSQVIVLGSVRQPPLASMLARDVEARLRMANRKDRLDWEHVTTRADWQRWRDSRIKALRASLGDFPSVPKNLQVRVTQTLKGDGYDIDNLVYQTRPGLVVTANLYRPGKPASSAPGIVICSSHFGAKDQGTRQDMAMTWARAGCFVLVPDHLGHGERRQHPFGDDDPHSYHFRYDTGIQLHLAGESLMGWLVWDLMRGVDVLLLQKGIDARRIIMISDPAGGGDVAAVAAALDERIAAVMVQNFGGPEPEQAYPLTRDAEESFNYAGSGSFEPTRNLRLSARDGFLPWTIVAAAAPRRLIYDHEFYWDRDQDPVWKRLQKVYGFYNAADALAGVGGRGFVVGSKPENTHWLAENRELFYPVLDRWFKIPNPKKEYSQRRPPQELVCLTQKVRDELRPLPLHALLSQLAVERTALARKQRLKLGLQKGRDQLRHDWRRLLGTVEPQNEPVLKGLPFQPERLGGIIVERIHLGTEPGIVVPVLLLRPEKRAPVIVAFAQEGKQAFLSHRSEALAELLQAGNAVCLLDVRGSGESRPDDSRDRRSAATSISASEWMLGDSLLAGRLRDVRALLQHLRRHPGVDGRRIALWGDSFAPVNAPNEDLKAPYTAAKRPAQSEPLGGLLAMLTALYEENGIKAVYVHRGLSDYHSVLQASFTYIPHDVIVPGVLATGDLCDVAAALAPLPLRLEGLVDGANRAASDVNVQRLYEPARTTYAAADATQRLQLGASPQTLSGWLSQQLQQ